MRSHLSLILLGLCGLAHAVAPPVAMTDVDRFLTRFDRNRDGRIDRKEWPGPEAAFARLDADKDRHLSRAELVPFKDRLTRLLTKSGKGGGRPGEVITPAAKGERGTEMLAVGDDAPDFTLPDLSGKQTVTLSSHRGKKPVVLIFASYT